MELNKEQAQKLIEAANNFSKALEPYAKEKTADELLLEEAEKRGYDFGQTITREGFSANYTTEIIQRDSDNDYNKLHLFYRDVFLGEQEIYDGSTKKWAKILKDLQELINTVDKIKEKYDL